ncbi:MarR family winged helix-turn-helix transcriptional regulator [Hyphobacterium sp.]|uniref:MarR family winged helix-turn-helix transcriptional regulator n=1 Tax=Hyphobacterium sp. TaxID=2004662 RepID=UPI003BAB804D
MEIPCACTTVRKANRALFRFYEAALEGSGLTITQFSILRALSRNGPTPLTALADELVMERTSLYRTIAPLQASGAIEIKAGGRGREKVAALTAQGEARIAAALPAWETAQSRVVSAIGAQRWAEMSALLLDIPEMLETRP